MKTPFAPFSRSGNRSSLLLALAAAALAGCGGSGAPDTRITKAPTITSQPKSVGVNVGGSATFSVKASGKGLTYQWFRNSTAISGATGSSLTINPVTPADFGSYSVRVGNDAGEVTSGFATLALPATGAPTITTQPTSVATTAGSAAEFSVEATGEGELTYQWYRNGTAIDGATGATYSIPSVGAGNTGSYYVIVTNAKGSTQSTSVTLTIVVPSAPAIQTQPISKTVPLGNQTSFTVVASGSPTLTYQWFKDGAEIPGANSATYTIPSVGNGDAGTYYVVVTNSLGSAQSNNATLAIGVEPTIVTEPSDATGNQGASITLTVSATGTSPLSYQWYRASGTTFVAIPGATASEYTIQSLSTSVDNRYRVVVTNNFGSDTSRTVTVTVVGPPAITNQPSNLTVGVGQPATFEVTATGTGPLTYQWYRNGTVISGATSANYTITSAQESNEGTYYVRVTNPGGTTQSNSVTLTVRPNPTITDQPDPVTVNAGGTAGFTVAATGEGTLTYQWYKDGVLITGATSATLTISNAQEANEGNYTVKVTDDGVATTTSNAARLTVN